MLRHLPVATVGTFFSLASVPFPIAAGARIARASMKSGMDVLCAAPPFKISPKPRCI
jgi:hypothetical protein